MPEVSVSCTKHFLNFDIVNKKLAKVRLSDRVTSLPATNTIEDKGKTVCPCISNREFSLTNVHMVCWSWKTNIVVKHPRWRNLPTFLYTLFLATVDPIIANGPQWSRSWLAQAISHSYCFASGEPDDTHARWTSHRQPQSIKSLMIFATPSLSVRTEEASSDEMWNNKVQLALTTISLPDQLFLQNCDCANT